MKYLVDFPFLNQCSDLQVHSVMDDNKLLTLVSGIRKCMIVKPLICFDLNYKNYLHFFYTKLVVRHRMKEFCSSRT